MMLQKKVVVGAFQCNCRILVCSQTAQAVVIDPGEDAPKIESALQSLEKDLGRPLEVRALLHTHGHLDHIGATRGLKERLRATKAPEIFLHRGDDPLYRELRMQGQMFGMKFDEPLPVDQFLEHEQQLEFGTLKLTVIHTPGHSPGSVSLRLHEDSGAGTRETVFTGDTLFKQSVGRTDLWGADQDQMFRSIRERLLLLDGDTGVCPGHGPDTSIASEKRENPFLR